MSKGFVTIPVGYTRVDAEPLENNTLFSTLDAAKLYASSDPTAYVGQIISVTEGKPQVYIVNNDKTLVPILSLKQQVEQSFSKTTNLRITHDLGYRPEVILLNEDRIRLYPLIEYVDENTIDVNWNGELSGIVYLV